MKRVLTIQDISCLGKCSSTVALPIISAMGVETVILPTALLSAHTGFKGNTFLDLSEELLPIAEHWKRENVHFDAVYTGYLGTEAEIETVKQIIHMFREDGTLVLVDPVMADHGKLYRGFSDSYVEENASLCAEANFIVPNLTESCLLTGMPYREDGGEDYLRELLAGLGKLCGGTAAITGIGLSAGHTGVVAETKENGRQEFFSCQSARIPLSYHGTGDIFASVTVGALMRGFPPKEALQTAVDYVSRTISITAEDPARTGKNEKFGVNFEETLPELVRKVNAAGSRSGM